MKNKILLNDDWTDDFYEYFKSVAEENGATDVIRANSFTYHTVYRMTVNSKRYQISFPFISPNNNGLLFWYNLKSIPGYELVMSNEYHLLDKPANELTEEDIEECFKKTVDSFFNEFNSKKQTTDSIKTRDNNDRPYGPVDFWIGRDFGFNTDEIGYDSFDYYLTPEEMAEVTTEYFNVHYGHFEMDNSSVIEMINEFRMNNRLFDNELFQKRCREKFMASAKEYFEEYLKDEEEYERESEEFDKEHSEEADKVLEDSCMKDAKYTCSTTIYLDNIYDYVLDHEDYYKAEMPEEFKLISSSELDGEIEVSVGVSGSNDPEDGWESWIDEVDIPDQLLPLKRMIEDYIADNEDEICDSAENDYDPDEAAEYHAEQELNEYLGK